MFIFIYLRLFFLSSARFAAETISAADNP